MVRASVRPVQWSNGPMVQIQIDGGLDSVNEAGCPASLKSEAVSHLKSLSINLSQTRVRKEWSTNTDRRGLDSVNEAECPDSLKTEAILSEI